MDQVGIEFTAQTETIVERIRQAHEDDPGVCARACAPRKILCPASFYCVCVGVCLYVACVCFVCGCVCAHVLCVCVCVCVCARAALAGLEAWDVLTPEIRGTPDEDDADDSWIELREMTPETERVFLKHASLASSLDTLPDYDDWEEGEAWSPDKRDWSDSE